MPKWIKKKLWNKGNRKLSTENSKQPPSSKVIHPSRCIKPIKPRRWASYKPLSQPRSASLRKRRKTKPLSRRSRATTRRTQLSEKEREKETSQRRKGKREDYFGTGRGEGRKKKEKKRHKMIHTETSFKTPTWPCHPRRFFFSGHKRRFLC